MADGAPSGWTGPTTVVDGQTLPLIDIKPSAGGNLGGVNLASHDIDALIRTTAAEAGNQGPQGQQAVAHVILNRSNNTGKSPKSIVSEPGQFEGYDNGNAAKISPDSEQYKTVANNISGVLNGQVPDPTNGATHFYSPKAQAALGRPAPAWAKGEGQQIGDHVFYNNVDGEHAPSPSNQITDDDLKGAKQVVTRGSPGIASQPDNQISDEDLVGAKPYSVGNQDVSSPASQVPKSPGYQKALAQAQQNPNALGQAVTGTLAQVPFAGLATNIPGAGNYVNSALNGFLAHGLPVIQGSANAIGQALHNIINKKSGISAGEAYAAGRDASQQALSSYGQQNPIPNTLADLSGQIGASALIPEAKGAGLGLRLLAGAAKVGGQSALTGAGGAASEGQSAGDIAKSAAVQGAIGTALSPLGEAGHMASLPFKTTGGKAVARLLAPSVIGGGLATGATYKATGNPKEAALAGLMVSGAAGVPGLLKSKAAQKALIKVIPEEDKLGALMGLTKAVGAETPEGAAIALENHPGKSVVEALNPDHREALMQTAGELNPNNLQHAQRVIEARQTLANIIARAKAGIFKATKINPAEAERGWEDFSKNRRQTVSAPLWEKVDTLAPVNTPEHNELLAKEPVVRQALEKAAFDLGPEGTVPNPNYKPPIPGKTASTLTPEDIQEVVTDARGSGHIIGEDVHASKREAPKNVPSINDPHGIADYLNKKHGYGQPGNGEPEHVYSQKAWVQAERIMRKMVPRYEQGPKVGQINYEKARTFEVQQSQRSVNAANKKHFEGLEEAKASSGEDAASEFANETAFDFNPKDIHGESAEKFIDRFDDMNEMQKDATKHGYLRRFYQKFRENPASTIDEYLNSDQHQKVMKAIFGSEGAEEFNHTLQQELDLEKQGKEISTFKPNQNKEGEALKVVPSSAFGYLTSGVKGALTGAFGAMQYQLAEHAHTLAKQGDMNPAARQHLGELLAKPTEEVAAELKQAAAHKRNLKASESMLAKRVGHATALVGANAVGPPINHALSNVNTNQ